MVIHIGICLKNPNDRFDVMYITYTVTLTDVFKTSLSLTTKFVILLKWYFSIKLIFYVPLEF